MCVGKTVNEIYTKSFNQGMLAGNVKRICETKGRLPNKNELVGMSSHELQLLPNVLDCLKNCLLEKIPTASNFIGVEVNTKISNNTNAQCRNDAQKVVFYAQIDTTITINIAKKKKKVYSKTKNVSGQVGLIAWCRCCQ